MNSTHTYGEWLQLQTRLLWIYDRVQSHWKVPAEWTEYADYNSAWLVQEGWAEVKYQGRVCRAEKGDWMMAPPHPRVQHFSAGVHLLSIAFQVQWPDGRHWYDHGLPVVVKAREIPQLEKVGRRLVKLVRRLVPELDWDPRLLPMNRAGFIRVQRELPELLEAYALAMDRSSVQSSLPQAFDERVETARRRLTTWPLHEPLDLNSLARACGLSRRQLERQFLEHVHSTPHRYLEQLRLQAASSALRQRDAQAKVIAQRLGFNDLSHFSHWFHRRTGVSPRAFRARML